MNAPKPLPLDWRNIGLLTLVHVAAIGGLALYLPLHGLSLAAAVIGVVLTVVSIFSISAGYHRLFSHRAYEANPALRAFLLFFGAGAFQNTALAWAADHRRHHGKTDSELDPYNAKRGFWYAAHRLGVPTARPRDRAAVRARPRTRSPGALPVQVLRLGGDRVRPRGADAAGARVRRSGRRLRHRGGRALVPHLPHHLRHQLVRPFLRRQPYSDRTSARDSFFVAILSIGEGYHNFHHTFPADYRNGVRLHQFDPTKWVLRVLSLFGVARNLRRTPVSSIVKATLRMDEKRLAQVGVSVTARERIEHLRTTIHELAERFANTLSAYEQAGSRPGVRRMGPAPKLRAELRAVQAELQEAQSAWQRMLRSIELAL